MSNLLQPARPQDLTAATESMVSAIHARGCRLVMATTGGGSGAISLLLQVGGASRTLLEAIVPYAAESLVEWLGGRPDQFCSAATARSMAMRAFVRARHLDEACRAIAVSARDNRETPKASGNTSESLIAPWAGVAATASLASDRPKHGAHRAFAALQTAEATVTSSLHLTSGRRTRGEEEALVARLVLNLVARAVGLSEQLSLDLGDGEQADTATTTAPAAWRQLLLGQVSAVRVLGEQHQACDAESGLAVFPGSFHPLHHGHRQMALIAGQQLGLPVAFEISIANVDKPPLDYTEIRSRLDGFSALPTSYVWLTQAPVFVEKAAIFPRAWFIVGADTIRRIGDPRYYQQSEEACQEAIWQLANRGCRFLVFARRQEGMVQTIDNLPLPTALKALCRQVPPAEFCDDISSTALRQRADQASTE